MIVWGYLLTIIDYMGYCLGCFMKRKAAMLAFDLVSKIFTALSLYCFGSLSGAYIYIVVFGVLIVANIKERLHKDYGKDSRT